MVQIRAVWFGTVQFGALYANLYDLTYLSSKVKGKNLVLHSSKYSNLRNTGVNHKINIGFIAVGYENVV
jgi:hypothetical protein